MPSLALEQPCRAGISPALRRRKPQGPGDLGENLARAVREALTALLYPPPLQMNFSRKGAARRYTLAA